jgi:microcystin-dependent protein
MGEALLFDAVRMQEIEDGTVVTGLVDINGHLLLERRDGTQIDAGEVRGEDGTPGDPGDPGSNGLSAYELWLAEGNVGTIDDFMDSLQGAAATLAAGMVIDWPYSSAVPSYALSCDGSAVSRSLYSALFGLIGTAYGVGDGSTTFNVPNLPSGEGGTVIGQNSRISGVTGITTTAVNLGIDVTVAFKAGRRYRISFDARHLVSSVAGDRMFFVIGVGTLAHRHYYGPPANGVAPSFEVYYEPPANANSTVSITAQRDLGTGTHVVSAEPGHPMTLTVEDVGPVGNPLVKKIIVATDQGLGPTIIQGGDGLGVGMIVGWGGDASAPIPANSLELNGQVVSAATYSALAAIYPSWVSGGNLTLPDARGKTLVGYKSGDPVFGTLGASVGASTHAHTLSDAGHARIGIGTPAGAARVFIDVSGDTTTYSPTNYASVSSVQSTDPGGTKTSKAKLGGASDSASTVQPSYIGRWLIIAADASGEYSPTVQTSLVAGQIDHESRIDVLEDGVWEAVIPALADISSTGSTATVNSTTGVITCPSGCTAVQVNNVFEPGYDYFITTNEQDSFVAYTDNMLVRFCTAGTPNTTTNYNTAGRFSMYNATSGVYAVAGSGIGVAVGNGYTAGGRAWREFMVRYAADAIETLVTRIWNWSIGAAREVEGTGSFNATTLFDGFRMYPSAGSFAGTFRIYRRKARI